MLKEPYLTLTWNRYSTYILICIKMKDKSTNIYYSYYWTFPSNCLGPTLYRAHILIFLPPRPTQLLGHAPMAWWREKGCEDPALESLYNIHIVLTSGVHGPAGPLLGLILLPLLAAGWRRPGQQNCMWKISHILNSVREKRRSLSKIDKNSISNWLHETLHCPKGNRFSAI